MTRKLSFAKTSRPRLFSVVPRERLFSIIDANKGRPLIWVSGPPGAGKTALVASYLERRDRPALWYQVDPGDVDPASVFYYLASAAEAHLEADTTPLPRFVSEHLSDLAGFSRLFFRALFARLPEDSLLVMDNYQEAPLGAPIHQIVCQCVAEAPPGVSIIGISRNEAPPEYVRLTASGAVVRIGWQQLQLTLDEVRAVAAERKVTDDWLVRALHQQSQGWAAGITLMLERLGNLDGFAHELPSETRESVFNYFTNLLFDQATETTRHNLLSMAFLPRITSSLASTVSGNSDAPTLLEDLYRRRMFTERRPGAGTVYQFHALFVEFLRGKAQQTFSSQDLESLLHRSASALEETGDIEAAIEIRIETGEWNEVSRLVLSQAKQILAAGRRQTLIRWIEAIPESALDSSPRLLLWLGRAQLQTSPELGSATLVESVKTFRRSDDRHGHVEALVALLVGAFVGFRDFGAMNDWLDELLLQMVQEPDFESQDQELWVWGVLCVTLFHIRPWHPLTIPAYKRVKELLPQCADPGVALIAATHALVVSGLCGDFEGGDRIAQDTESLAVQELSSPSDAAWWYGQVGWLRFIQARYEEALEYLNKGCRIAMSNDLRTLLRHLLLWRYMVEFRGIGWNAANATMAEVEAIPISHKPMSEAQQRTYKSHLLIHIDRNDDAADLAMLGQAAANRTGSSLEVLVFSLSNAGVLLAAGRTDDARPLIPQARQLTERAPIYDCWRAATVFAETWLAYTENDTDRTLRLLRQSLGLARTGKRRHYLRFCDCALRPLFRLALEQGIEVDLVQDLIRMFRVTPPAAAPDNWPWPVRIVTLGLFEIRINGEPVKFSRKLPRKTLLLLKAILAFGGQDVPEQLLADALWGDEDGDAARNALSITVIRLRKLLGTSDAVLQLGGRVSLNSACCWVDASVFEAAIDASGGMPEKILNLYGGSFLPDDLDESWSVAARERLRGKFIHALSSHGALLENDGNLTGATQCYLRGIDADQIVESFHQGLMRCYERLGRRSEAFSVYRRLRHTLSVILGVPPADETNRLFQDMLERQSAEGLSVSLSDIDTPKVSRLQPKKRSGR